jgi:predicted outer membrane repeat protein
MRSTHLLVLIGIWRRIVYCLLPLGLGTGVAILLLVAGGRPVGSAQAAPASLTYPGCAPTIQDCLDSVADGQTVYVQAGTYITSLTLSRAVSLVGALSSTTILQALPGQRVLTVTGAVISNSVVISGLTFSGGQAAGLSGCPDGCGGGIAVLLGARPQLNNLQFVSNTANDRGGGLFTENIITLTASSFISNTANRGGGLMSWIDLTLIDTSFLSNTAVNGGGVYAYDPVSVSGGAFVGNKAAVFGGGLRLDHSGHIADTTFLNNTAGLSGGGLAAVGSLSLIRSIFISNSATTGDGGGALLNWDSSALEDHSLADDLFADNRAGGFGDGVNLDGRFNLMHLTFGNKGLGSGTALYVDNDFSSVNIVDTIIASHTVGINVTAGAVTDDYNLFFGNAVNTMGPITSTGHSFVGNPLFVDPTHGNYHLAPGSAAKDRGIGTGNYLDTTDIDGDNRWIGAGTDIGFDEFVPSYRYLPLLMR